VVSFVSPDPDPFTWDAPMLSFRLLPLILLAAVAVPFPSALAAGTARRPNILVIVADDLGYADPGFQGGRDVPTPRLDALAASGVRCTSGYVSGPYCSPTRAGLLTGRYQQRFGHEFNPGPPAAANVEVGLPLTERTLPELLRAGGYRTGLVGKWHLGHAEPFLPQSRGFEESFGFLGGAHPYLPAGRVEDGVNAIRRGHDPVDEPEYLTRAFAREAVSFIDRHREEPFFLLLTFNAVHGPLQAPPDGADRFPEIADPRRKAYAEMLAELDVAVGRVLDRLDETKLADDTLVVFISDNGGPPANASSNGALRGFKASTWEGGIRVPFVVRWPGHLPAGKTFDRPVIQLDILPTALAAAGVTVPAGLKLDGVDLVPHLAGRVETPPHEHLFWRFGEQKAIRSGDWKLVRANGISDPILINLVDDGGETTDRSAVNPDKRRELESAWREWNGQLTAPLWKKQAKPGQGRQRQRRAGAAAS
jgi:arylsulfatase A-like enzyme